ncbi:xylosyl- and glucuronyltransferase LARGE1-like isoform X3 [Hylaeus anthracinus]|uniref:xylosyl- and glucuronyltransferase LARGE1-like isoform X3 n=1 Tax=Hylaeus anthracinus TaxID=313031 RepID=UPI0023B99193|nr:xylosyl- and glucuronyltransferase LARGE1-like isoform X3 [Hylaeus anthracinus]
MARPWLGCLFGILIPSTIFYLYLLLNVPSAGIGSFKLDGKSGPFSVDIEKSSFHVDGPILHKLRLESNRAEVKCETIHIAMVCAGYNSTFSLVTVVKSILFYRTKPLHFHLLVDEIAKRTLTTLFRTWDLPHVNLTYYKAELWVPKVSWIPNKHYSGVYGLLKLILPDAMRVDKVLVFDTDVTVLNDVGLLWRSFENFEDDQALGLTENQSHWYIKALSYGQRPWPALSRGFNTGVMLMDLQQLRNRKFTTLWETVTKRVLAQIPETSLADQDVINAVIKEHPSIVYRIECTWNIQLSEHTISDLCYRDSGRISIVHWNSPRKQDVYNKHINEFRKWHKVFLEMDGNLLRRRLFDCDKHEAVSQELYPINYLRNTAMSYVSTPFIFQLDVDFLPQYGLHESLMGYITKLNVSESDRVALIVPAFETERYRFTFPANKDEVLKFLKRGVLYTFRYHVWTQGHAATNYSYWRNTMEPYEVSWEPDFEPYIVVSKLAPRYDTRFIGFGWNKVSYLTHLTVLDYKYIVLPDTFIIHRPHAPSLDIGKFRTDSIYRRCLKKLKDDFVEELVTKYGESALSKLKKVTKEEKILKLVGTK